MRKTISLFLFTIIFVAFYIFNLHKDIEVKLLDINHKLKIYYIQKLSSLENIIIQYKDQANTIERLQKQILINKMNNIPLFQLKQEINNLKNFNSSYIIKDNIFVAKSLHFEKLNTYTRIWLDFDKTDNKINGLIIHDMAAGIVKFEKNHPIALLNQDEKCNYGVYIGKDNAIGITHGIKNSQNILIKFIPLWNNIKLNDEVITNGLDNIFFEGLKVGRVIKIIKKINHLEAIVKPYASASAQSYYSIYKSPTMQP
jgi:rod shape-determining protein MreC